MTPELPWASLPGGERVRRGLEQLRQGDVQAELLLVLLAAPALRRVGLEWPALATPLPQEPHLLLYMLLQKSHGDEAHAQYNALLRELDSFVAAVESLDRSPHGEGSDPGAAK